MLKSVYINEIQQIKDYEIANIEEKNLFSDNNNDIYYFVSFNKKHSQNLTHTFYKFYINKDWFISLIEAKEFYKNNQDWKNKYGLNSLLKYINEKYLNEEIYLFIDMDLSKTKITTLRECLKLFKMEDYNIHLNETIRPIKINQDYEIAHLPNFLFNSYNEDNKTYFVKFDLSNIYFGFELKEEWLINEKEAKEIYKDNEDWKIKTSWNPHIKHIKEDCLNEEVLLMVNYQAYFIANEFKHSWREESNYLYTKTIKTTLRECLKFYFNKEWFNINLLSLDLNNEKLHFNNTQKHLITLRIDKQDCYYRFSIPRDKAQLINKIVILGIEVIKNDLLSDCNFEWFKEWNNQLNDKTTILYITNNKQGKEVNLNVSIKELVSLINNDIDLSNKQYFLNNLVSYYENKEFNYLTWFYNERTQTFNFTRMLNNKLFRFKIPKSWGNVINNVFYLGKNYNDNEASLKELEELANKKEILLNHYKGKNLKATWEVCFIDLYKIFIENDIIHLTQTLKNSYINNNVLS